jgi:putative nucleotidyltransferase with HDIG domain
MQFFSKNRTRTSPSEIEPRKKNYGVKIFIGFVLVLVITLLFPSSESIEYSYSVGAVWVQNDLIAPFSFPIYKDEKQYQQEVESAVRSVYPVFDRRDERMTLDTLSAVIERLQEAAEVRLAWQKSHSLQDSLKLQRQISSLGFTLSENDWNLLMKWKSVEAKHGGRMFQWLKENIVTASGAVIRSGVVDVENVKKLYPVLAIRKGTIEEIIDSEKLLERHEAIAMIRARLVSLFGESDTATLVETILQNALLPTIVYNAAETQRAMQIARDNVPRTLGFVQENERIVSKHERITEEVKQKLDSFRKAKVERGDEHSLLSQRVGIFFHVLLVISLYSIYLFLFRKRIFHNNALLTLIGLLILMETAIAYLTLQLNVESPLQYLIVIPAASMLLTIIFDSRVAFYGTVTMAFLVAGIRGNDYSIALASLVAGSLAAYTVRDIRNRSQIFRSLGFIFLGYAVSIFALGLERFESLDTIVKELSFALANAVFSPVLTYGLLIFFERVFNVTTDLTLLELSDFNNPLLRQLSEQAPGTFHHSITIGNLAEAAAEAIGANSILARVGAYYHDIGKIKNAEYFVENQSPGQNKHSKLRPRMSALIITSHVKEGIELAREYGLPEKVIDFIPQHHGTTRVSYFYDKALKQAASRKTPKDIHEDDFRYPGPKPQTKETGIVMLADAVEATTRTIEELTPQKLEQTIENTIKQRFIEGQLDECDLTLRDLTNIKEAFLKILSGIHHHRIKYPGQETQEVPPVDVPPEAEPLVEAMNIHEQSQGTSFAPPIPVHEEQPSQHEPPKEHP